MERMRRNVKCPFLSAGRCSIYEARPQTCRNYHATDVAGCQQSYEDPDNLDIDPEFAPLVYQAGGAHVDAFTRAMREEGYDTNVYEMNCALDTALSEPDARERFEHKRAPFKKLAGDDVPGEFEELAE
jgi:Fe-S-cluster containining protein